MPNSKEGDIDSIRLIDFEGLLRCGCNEIGRETERDSYSTGHFAEACNVKSSQGYLCKSSVPTV
jgi:hypothetical protein